MPLSDESVARYRSAQQTFRTLVLPKIRRQAWRDYVRSLVEKGSLTEAEARLPRWKSPETGLLVD